MSVKVINNIQRYKNKSESQLAQAITTAASDIERMSKSIVPVGETANLKNSFHIKNLNKVGKRLTYEMEYSAYQHRGMRKDGTRVVRNYTKPGTGKDFLRAPAQKIFSQLNKYIKAAL